VGAGKDAGYDGRARAAAGNHVVGGVAADGDVPDIVGAEAERGLEDEVGPRAAAAAVLGAQGEVDAVPPAEGVQDAGLGAAAEAGEQAHMDTGAADALDGAVGAGNGLEAAAVDELA